MNAHENKKIFELNLTNEEISAEGGEVELYEYKDYCILLLNLYGESGWDKYSFKFKRNYLIKTTYLKYRYKNGLLITDDDLKISYCRK